MSAFRTADETDVATKKLFCGICEASCGLVATVSGDDVLALRPDPDHPNSRGFACSKGVAFPAVRDDPDRVLRPMRRQTDGSFAPVSWDEALDDIGRRLREVIKQHGRESVGVLGGNPLSWNYAGYLWLFGMAAALKTKHLYTVASIDINNYWAVGQLVYGNNLVNPVPDLERTHFFLCLGANPVVSHGSMINVGRIRETMLAITARGGRVVVVDPRRTETARLFEHLPIRPGGDVWLLAAMLKVILEEGLADLRALEQTRGGHATLVDLVRGVDLARAERESGIALPDITQLARDFARAPSASVYGRCGASLGPFATLTKYLIDALNIATGNLDRPGGWVFSQPMLDLEFVTNLFGMAGYDRWRTRVDGFPELMGTSPIASIPREIRTPGKGQLRAMLVLSANPVTSAPASGDMEAALTELDLLVCLDPYLTETARHADYVLPPALWLERDGFPNFTQAHAAVPYAQWVPATVAPRGEAQEDWWIIDEICERIGIVPSAVPGAQLLGRLRIRFKPAFVADLLMRIGPAGDLFGLRRRGVSRKKLFRHPSGVKLRDDLPTGVLRERLHHKDHRVHLDAPIFFSEMERLLATPEAGDAVYPLRLITIRELRSQNSWMHNVAKLMAADRVQRLRIHPDDAARFDIDEGDEVAILSHYGAVTAPATLTVDMMPGTVALPQGWGHGGGWRRAVAAGGSSYNRLTTNIPSEIDVPTGNAVFNGVAVRVQPVHSSREN